MKVEAHYDPDEPGGSRELFLFHDGDPVDVARLVDQIVNSKRKRHRPATVAGSPLSEADGAREAPRMKKTNTIPYADMKERKE
jgi:hypothetical protein